MSVSPADRLPHNGRVLRAWEWRRLHRTPLPALADGFAQFRAWGGTTVGLDISYVVDISELLDPVQRAAAAADYRARLRAYVATASRAGLSVEAVAGSPHWGSPDARYVCGVVGDYVAAFNAAAPLQQQLTGLHFDVEPWGLPDWPARRLTYAQHLLETVALMAAQQGRTPAPGRVPITVDLPFWLDGTGEPQTVDYHGVRTSPTRHVMRLLDNAAGQRNTVVIMAYRDTTAGPDGSAAAVAGELAAARQHAGRVLVGIGQEIRDVQPPHTTFHQEGAAALQAALRTLRQQYQGEVGFGGFAVNDLAALTAALLRD